MSVLEVVAVAQGEDKAVAVLTFTVFRVWTGDVVEVFDGSALVARLHGFDRAWPPLRTTGDMTVKFTTDGVTERAFNYLLTDGWSLWCSL